MLVPRTPMQSIGYAVVALVAVVDLGLVHRYGVAHAVREDQERRSQARDRPP
jgi:hypothetical protein